MKDSERGVAKWRARAEQGRDFSGLRFGSITPTDIDGSMDFGGRVFVFMEAKHRTATLPSGQRKHLEYQCISHTESGRDAIALVLMHDTPVTEQINFAECEVVEFWMNGRWHKPKRSIKARRAIELFLSYCNVRAA